MTLGGEGSTRAKEKKGESSAEWKKKEKSFLMYGEGGGPLFFRGEKTCLADARTGSETLANSPGRKRKKGNRLKRRNSKKKESFAIVNFRKQQKGAFRRERERGGGRFDAPRRGKDRVQLEIG